ncbi:MAG: sulfatase-like hydrolase/transferase [Planctomycetes bacterium]|nr:sulfatase-like hydrolase/transferase [Planctomycetota bacterium]
MHTRRESLKRFVLLAATALAVGPRLVASPDGTGRRPNIIFILADDLGWGDLGCYGHPHIKTPRLDRLAREGTLFTQFYVNSGVCSPSRTAFMTGQYPARHRIHGHLASAKQNEARGMPNFLDPDVPTVTRILKDAGYATAHFGKWHLGHGEGAPEPGAYGIDAYRTVVGNGPTFDTKDPWLWAKSTGLIVDEALRFIEANREKPFFINLWTLVPHATLNPTDEQMEPYKRFGPGSRVPHKGALQIYYAAVGDMDRQIGRLLDGLARLDLAKETIIIFSSDNGPEDIHILNASHSGVGSAGPLRGRKRSLYEGGVRMPLIVRWPGRVPAGAVDDVSVVAGVDFLPTVCAIAGLPVPAGHALDGEDRSPVLRGAAGPRAKPIHWEWRFRVAGHVWNQSPMLSIRDGDWKLLMNPDRSRVELYDIPRDPRERDDRSAEEPEVVDRLAKKLIAWQKTLPPGPIEPAAGRDDYPWPGTTARRAPERRNAQPTR